MAFDPLVCPYGRRIATGSVCIVRDIPGIDNPKDCKPRTVLVLSPIQPTGPIPIAIAGIVVSSSSKNQYTVQLPDESNIPECKSGLDRESFADGRWGTVFPPCMISKTIGHIGEIHIVAVKRQMVAASRDLLMKQHKIGCPEGDSRSCSHCRPAPAPSASPRPA